MFVDRSVQVPLEYVKNSEIVLNVGFEATSALKLGNDTIEFKARFGGSSREIVVPVDHVIAIYARENGQGMAFPAPTAERRSAGDEVAADADGRAGAASGPHLALAEGAAHAAARHGDGRAAARTARPPAGARAQARQVSCVTADARVAGAAART